MKCENVLMLQSFHTESSQSGRKHSGHAVICTESGERIFYLFRCAEAVGIFHSLLGEALLCV